MLWIDSFGFCAVLVTDEFTFSVCLLFTIVFGQELRANGMNSFSALLVAQGIGSAFIGFIFCLGLHGTMLAQTTYYFRTFPDDSKAWKSLVCLLCAVDALHTYLVSYTVWDLFIIGPSVGASLLLKIPWQLMAAFVVAYNVVTVVQCFFAWKVWTISGKNKIITSIIAASSAVQLVSGLASSAHLAIVKSPTLAFNRQGVLYGRLQLIFALISDLAISGSMVYYFSTFRVGLDRTKNILQYLILISINMGFLLCLLTILTLILFEVQSGTFKALGPHLIISKIYVNSLLATRNSRKHFRDLAGVNNSHATLVDLR